ncbi:E3 ubiquitin-protein ligase HERC2-like protein [Histomonas meleagridis]|uniref:E3 ubiquitin-protein ligase HERC2-like protein n=1 Tax=Histomonas meleagridis TaxID=135588 RepID=UPI00355A4584|nr:E3 ubiquitin-protein ligase HERC2-like protein [Histomonas meleagridis]KAH0804504.1 E3 ubiquitin-protein ligase HERC2-like protein [Histomonas meleagridis]
MNITVKITLNNPRTQIPYDLICTYSQSETFEDGEFLQGAQILRPFVVGQGNTFISLIGQGNTDPWKLFTIKLEYPEQRTIVDKSPYQVNIDEIHDVFISDMQQFACKWKESHTEELLQLFSRTQLQSPTFGDVESIAKSSSLCSQFSPNVVILRALLIHYYNYIRYKHRNNLNKQILDSLRKLISIDEAASGIIESIITPKECMITSPRYAPQMVFNRHAAQRIILDGKGETKWSMVSQLTQYVQKYKAEGLRYKYFPWHIQFEGESAIDAGGPGREVVVEVATSIFEPTTKLMVQLTQSNTFVPDEESTTRLNDYYTIGVYLGIIVRNGFSQDLPFANIVWKYLAGEKITKKDIMNEDSTLGTLFKNLNEDLITTNWIITGWNQKKILLPNHKDVKVEKDDIDQYIDEFINYRINSILPMLEQMRNGFRDNIGFKHHNLLSGCTLSRLAQGSGAISVQYLKSITTVTGFSDGMQNPIIQRFWRAVERLNQEQLKLLLKFITTFTRLPNSVIAPNFKLKIDNNVNVSGDPNQLLPSASTCFNLLHLPSYTDDEAAYEKIVYAITYCQTMENK